MRLTLFPLPLWERVRVRGCREAALLADHGDFAIKFTPVGKAGTQPLVSADKPYEAGFRLSPG